VVEYRNEGNNDKAKIVLDAFGSLPPDSAARLYDILTK
jgi:hypothetical protein